MSKGLVPMLSLMWTSLPLSWICHPMSPAEHKRLETRIMIPLPRFSPSPECKMCQCASVQVLSKDSLVSRRTARSMWFITSHAFTSSNLEDEIPPQFHCQIESRFLEEWCELHLLQSFCRCLLTGVAVTSTCVRHPMAANSAELYCLPLYQANPEWMDLRYALWRLRLTTLFRPLVAVSGLADVLPHIGGCPPWSFVPDKWNVEDGAGTPVTSMARSQPSPNQCVVPKIKRSVTKHPSQVPGDFATLGLDLGPDLPHCRWLLTVRSKCALPCHPNAEIKKMNRCRHLYQLVSRAPLASRRIKPEEKMRQIKITDWKCTAQITAARWINCVATDQKNLKTNQRDWCQVRLQTGVHWIGLRVQLQRGSNRPVSGGQEPTLQIVGTPLRRTRVHSVIQGSTNAMLFWLNCWETQWKNACSSAMGQSVRVPSPVKTVYTNRPVSWQEPTLQSVGVLYSFPNCSAAEWQINPTVKVWSSTSRPVSE